VLLLNYWKMGWIQANNAGKKSSVKKILKFGNSPNSE
jgi:hypothetical protein